MVAAMTLADVLKIFAGWRRSPPAHRLVAAFVGFKPPPDPEPAAADGAQFAQLLARFPTGHVPMTAL